MALTTTGIAIQILSSIRAFRENPSRCTVNDCKVVVNHLIRKFSEPLGRDGEAAVKKSKSVFMDKEGSSNIIREHAVPVIVLLEELLELDEKSLVASEENVEWIEKFLRESLLLVEVTREEDRQLSRKGFQRDMPDGWRDETNNLYRDPLARYKECGIEVVN